MLARKIKLNLNKKQQRTIDGLSLTSAKLYNELLKINFERLNNGDTLLSSYAMINLIRNEKISSDIKDRICNRVFNALIRYTKSEKITCANEQQIIQPERERFLDKQIHAIQNASRTYKRSLA